MVFVSQISAIIINVPGDQPTIQAGINESTDGDTILVQPGTYIENINFNGKNITVASLFLTTQETTYISQTIIDGNQSGNVVTFESGEDFTAKLYGFTVRNGNAGSWPDGGGGLYCSNSSPKIEYVIFTGNTSNYIGGGIYCWDSDPILKNVIISGNNASHYGGGIFCNYHSSPTLKNIAIVNNTATSYGGGLCCMQYSNPLLENVTISGNISSMYGGGIYCHIGCDISLTNCVLWDDSQPEIHIESGSITATYSAIEGGWSGIGNIDIDPLFVNSANGDYRLLSHSPCIDSGNPLIIDPDGSTSDMGAFSFPEVLNISADTRFGYENLNVEFTNLSIGFTDTSIWSWDFQNDGIYDSFEQNPTFNYTSPGIYNVKLKIQKENYCDSLMKSTFIIVQESQLQPPQNPLITISGDDIILLWNSVVNADYYLVYLSDNFYGNFEFLDYTTANTTYTHSGASTTNNKMFYFIIGFDGSMDELTLFIDQNQRKNIDNATK